MNNHVRKLVREYLKTFKGKKPEAQEADIQAASERLRLYEINVHGQTAIYQQAGIIYHRLLRKMEHKKEIQHSERAHALLSASGAKRWLNCTPSPRLEEHFPEETSTYAEEGTLAHELAELVLSNKTILIMEPKQYSKALKNIKANPLYSEDMPDYVQIHVDYVLEQYNAAKKRDKFAVILIEERVDFTHLVAEGFGTCDVIIIAEGVLEVIDLKYGAGVRVAAEDNDQLKLYGSGALEKYDMLYGIHTVKLTITQPRMDSISSWEITAEQLRAWGENVVKPTALIAYEGAGEQKTGDWCKFCKASPKCKAQNEQALEAAKKAFADPQLLTDEELTEVYSRMPYVENWFKDVAAFMYSKAIEGKKWEGLKLVEGQSRRQWTDEEAVKEVLFGNYKVEEFTNSKVKGIGDIEKLVGKKNFPILFAELCKAVKTSPSLVPETDKRPEMKPTNYFEDDYEDL